MSNLISIKDHQATTVFLGDFIVGQDQEGRYCLNDLHKAAGGLGHHRPSKWLATAQTKDLVSQVEAQNRATKPVSIRKGQGVSGTYVTKELVYAYAMWISPSFHLRVIQAYKRLATRGVAIHENAAQYILDNPAPYFETIIEQVQHLTGNYAQLIHKVELDAPKIKYHDAVAGSSNLQTISEVGKKYGIGRNKLYKLLRKLKVLMADKFNSPYQRHIDSGCFVVVGKVSSTANGPIRTNKTMVTGKGEIYIGKLLSREGWSANKLAA